MSAIDLNIGPPLDAAAVRNYKTIKEIFQRLMELCVQGEGVTLKPRKHEQRLLRNLGAHSVVLELLRIPYDKVCTHQAAKGKLGSGGVKKQGG